MTHEMKLTQVWRGHQPGECLFVTPGQRTMILTLQKGIEVNPDPGPSRFRIPDKKAPVLVSTKQRKYVVDIVIPVLDRQEETILTLDALFLNNKKLNVIIVDNGSDNLSYLKRYEGIGTVIKNKTNLGAIRAINQGIKKATSKYIVIMHNDVVIKDLNWIDKAISIMDNDNSIGIVGLAGWKQITKDGICPLDKLVTGLDGYDGRDIPKDGEVTVLDGCCNVIRNIGLQLDKRYDLFHFYDMDFSMQYKAKGYNLYVMNANANHLAQNRMLSTIKSNKYLEATRTNDREYWRSRQAIFTDKWKDSLPCYTRPFMTFIFRCTNRPGSIRRALIALQKQTDPDYQLLCLFDDKVNGMPFANKSLVVAKDLIKGKYVYIYEDDDEFIYHDFIKDLKKLYIPDVIMFKANIGSRTYPTNKPWNRTPELGKIGTPCFCVTNEVYQKHIYKWDRPTQADYFFIEDIFKQDYKIHWWDEIINQSYSYHRTNIEKDPVDLKAILDEFNMSEADILYGHDI